MGGKRDRDGEAAGGTAGSGEAFARSLEARRKAALGLEKELLTEVPLLYGSADNPRPNMTLGRLHQEERVGRHGGGVPPGARRRRSNAALPFEPWLPGLVFLLGLLFFLSK